MKKLSFIDSRLTEILAEVERESRFEVARNEEIGKEPRNESDSVRGDLRFFH